MPARSKTREERYYIRLKTEALKICRARGHSMRQFLTPVRTLKADKIHEKLVGTTECGLCGLYVQVNTDPLPNEIDIGGPAVAENCTYKGATTVCLRSSSRKIT